MLTFSKWLGVAILCWLSAHAQAKGETKDCVEALRIAARDEYKLADDKSLDTAFSDAFCDAVKSKRESKSKQDGSALYGAFFATLSNDQSELSNYDRTYCRDTRSKLNFKSAYRSWASVVHGEPLQQFNLCMKTAMQGAASRGIFSEVGVTDACHTVVGAAYRPTGDGPKTAKVNSVHTYNVQCSNVPSVLKANVQKFECRRTSWGAGVLSLGTSQEPIDINFDALTPPAPPSPPAVSATDTKTATFIVKRAAYDAGVTCVHDGRQCDGPISLGAGSQVLSVTYSCTGPVNQNGHGYCGWSFGDRGAASYAANWKQVGDGELRWFRYWDGDASRAIVETYTVAYTAPHAPTAAEVAQLATYEAELTKHRALIATGPCPTLDGAQKATKGTRSKS